LLCLENVCVSSPYDCLLSNSCPRLFGTTTDFQSIPENASDLIYGVANEFDIPEKLSVPELDRDDIRSKVRDS
jgi:hypothetical protein